MTADGLPVIVSQKPSIDPLVAAVEAVAQTLIVNRARIAELERYLQHLDAEQRQLQSQLDDAGGNVRQAEDRLAAETARASRLEAAAVAQTKHADLLNENLKSLHGDLARVTEAVASALGMPE